MLMCLAVSLVISVGVNEIDFLFKNGFKDKADKDFEDSHGLSSTAGVALHNWSHTPPCNFKDSEDDDDSFVSRMMT